MGGNPSEKLLSLGDLNVELANTWISLQRSREFEAASGAFHVRIPIRRNSPQVQARRYVLSPVLPTLHDIVRESSREGVDSVLGVAADAESVEESRKMEAGSLR